MITTYEQEGIKKGRAEGRAERRTEGKQESLLLLLEERFGSLPVTLQRKVKRVDTVEKLDALLIAALNCRSLDDLKF